MTTYSVIWVIDIEADTPYEAARKALDIQRDPGSTATVFGVKEEHSKLIRCIDLSKPGYDTRL